MCIPEIGRGGAAGGDWAGPRGMVLFLGVSGCRGGGLRMLHCLRVSGCAAAWYQLIIGGHSEMISYLAVPWKPRDLERCYGC